MGGRETYYITCRDSDNAGAGGKEGEALFCDYCNIDKRYLITLHSKNDDRILNEL